jgi:hypothetical protein
MPEFYVYVYRDPSRKNEAIYVGKGQGDRARSHLDSGSHSILLNRRLAKMKRNGIEPIINVVDMPSEALAHQCEIDTIARLGRKDLKLGPLLNQTDGGEGTSGYIHTDKARQKQSQAKKGKSRSLAARKKISDTQKGRPSPIKDKPKSTAHRKKLSDVQKGKPKAIVTCSHCGKEGGKGIMQRWHFDNCKHKKVS